jgi:hypothetical protein
LSSYLKPSLSLLILFHFAGIVVEANIKRSWNHFSYSTIVARAPTMWQEVRVNESPPNYLV